MTARRNAIAASTAASWIVLTMVVREEQVRGEPTMIGDGEDDGVLLTNADVSIVEITTKTRTARIYIRYFYARRDAQVGSEVHLTNGHVMIVQEPLDEVKAMLPGFVEVHASGAPSEIMVNPTTVRFMHGHYPQLGQTQAEPGSKLTFANGHKLEVTESFDELAGQFGVN